MSSSYDRIPYPRHSYAFTHPDRMATLATLHGMSPPPVARCRVLELGCASGSNLIPMAYALPHSEFVGIDSSHRQMDDARKFAD
ncbi:MAG TPA: class I SAM-dependent methyltransferase, partial [Pirellulales bacterium]|nr:class I SAM-dependent methyltransferase [Pirellulales bacterium]